VLFRSLELDLSKSGSTFSPTNWPCEQRFELVNNWLSALTKPIQQKMQQMKKLLPLLTITYKRPTLLDLPAFYADIFCYYSQKKCRYCSRVPKESAVCLVCGAHLSLKSSCCDQMRSAFKIHLNECGAGTSILLSVYSTYVFIVRSKRFISWASVYLDDHGEEDKDLKRGKPLNLSQQRYNLLKALWCNHAFDYQNTKWNSANLLAN